MYQIDLKKPVHAHFIGIGGTSMSGLAEYLFDVGFRVSGSDSAHSKYTKHLESLGIEIFYPQKAENIQEGTDVVIFSAAIHPGNPEYDAAVEKGIPMLTRAELLGQLMAFYQHAINISGTHGKTTTTSMVTDIFLDAGLDPAIEIGGMLDDIGGNMRLSKKQDYFVAEACEYTNSFLSFHPTCAIILNVEADHLDFFKDLDDIRHSFRKFVELLPDGGNLIIGADIDNYEYFYEGLNVNVLTFGKAANADYRAENIVYDEFVRPAFDVIEKGVNIGRVQLGVPGEHNVMNALAAIAAARAYDIEMDVIKGALLRYHGTQRRFDIRGHVNGFTVMDDYAHHPQEVDAVLKTLVKYPHHKLWAIQQPHTYSRTKLLMDDFADVLSQADAVLVLDIFPARETDDLGCHATQLVEKLKERGSEVYYTPTFDDVEKFVIEHGEEGDIFITLGCGNANIVADRIVERYGTKES
ncbi:MAG: UDP-N-acetylmuramate--L-alanine ligase [Solobacterium sp.]|nr:UDP-N-acetylmuramate--L-alanine ligase [Solobacterium sp.]